MGGVGRGGGHILDKSSLLHSDQLQQNTVRLYNHSSMRILLVVYVKINHLHFL